MRVVGLPHVSGPGKTVAKQQKLRLIAVWLWMLPSGLDAIGRRGNIAMET